MFLPYRCDRCDCRFFQPRWLSQFPDFDDCEREPLWTSARVGFPVALAVIAVSTTVLVFNWSKPDPKDRRGAADRTASVARQPDESHAATSTASPGVDRIDDTMRASTTPRLEGDSRGRSGALKNGSYLRSSGSIVVVASDEATALRLRKRSENLNELIQQGSVFSVPTGTAVTILAGDVGLVQVRILESAMAGRDGWIQPGQLVVGRQQTKK